MVKSITSAVSSVEADAAEVSIVNPSLPVASSGMASHPDEFSKSANKSVNQGYSASGTESFAGDSQAAYQTLSAKHGRGSSSSGSRGGSSNRGGGSSRPSSPSPSRPSSPAPSKPSTPSPSQRTPSPAPSAPRTPAPAPSAPSQSKPSTPASPAPSAPRTPAPAPSAPSQSKPSTPASPAPSQSKPSTPATPAPSAPRSPSTPSPASSAGKTVPGSSGRAPLQLQNSNTARISNSPHGSAVSSHGSSQPAGSSAVSRHATYYPVQHHANVTVHVNVGSSSHYHHPHGYDHHGLPNGYWHYDPHNGWHYSHWAPQDPHYHHYADNWHYHYHHDHHYYWSYYPDYHYYPHHWHSYVYVVPPSEYDSTPRYRGPEIDVSRLDKLMESKWAIDQLRADLNDVPFAERETDSYRFFVKDVIDSYQYLLLKVYEFASRSDWRGVHHDPTYQRAVESIWGASLAVLQDYEAQFPYDTAMRADSLTVLYSNIAETKLVRDSDYARNNPFYVALLDKIGREISF